MSAPFVGRHGGLLGLLLLASLLVDWQIDVRVALAACSDTVLVRAAKTYTKSGSSTVIFVDTLTVTPVPGRRFLLEVLRPGTSNPLTSARVAYAGVEYFGVDDVDATNTLLSRTITPQGPSTLKVTLSGGSGAHLVVRLTQVPEPLFNVYSSSFNGASTPKSYTKYFSPAEGVPATPHVLTLTNGNADSTGSARTFDAEVWLNSSQIIYPGEVTTGRAFLTRNVTLESDNTLQVNLVGGQTGKKVSIKISGADVSAPALAVSSPVDSSVTTSSNVSASANVNDDETEVRLFVDGLEKALTGGTWTSALSLPADGKFTFAFVAQNGACLADSTRRTVIRDTRAPTLSVSSPANGQVLASGTSSVNITGQFYDSTRTTVVIEGDTVGVFTPVGAAPVSFSKVVPLDHGSNGLLIRAIDAAGNVAKERVVVLVPPALAALRDSNVTSTAIAPVGIPTFRSQVDFLFTGPSPLQINADASKIQAGNESVVRGVVASRDFGPLANVRVSILNHPEYGATMSRADGEFDLAVTGGASYVVRLTLPDYLEAQRSVWASSLDYAVMDTIALIGRSSTGVYADTTQATFISGKIEGDLNNDRRLHVLVPPGAEATITPDSGSVTKLWAYRVRVKEFTVGNEGPRTMPAQLPSTTAYTYCADLSLVEADSILVAMGPRHPAPVIVFSKPIITYVKEFLGLPVGTLIPSGYYDQHTGKWIADEDGRVIKIVGVVGGIANLDTNGDNAGDSDELYVASGIDTLERTQLATQFGIGDILWRDRVTHFSGHDFNLNMGQILGLGAPTGGDAGPSNLLIGDPNKSCGCIIENENRVLGESIPIKGTPFTLNYRSSRQPGDKASRWIRVPLTGATVPSGLTAVRLVVTVAGKQYKQTYTGVGADDVRIFSDWDGKDAYGRSVAGSVPATVQVGYVFGQTYSTSTSGKQEFANRGNIRTAPPLSTTGNRSNGYVDWHTYKVAVGAPTMASAGLGGWTISPHHFMDTNGGGALYLGNGSARYGGVQFPTIRKFAGKGAYASSIPDTNNPAQSHRSQINISPRAMTFGPDGSLYFVGIIGTGQASRAMVFRIKPDGIIHPWVGCSTCPTSLTTNFFVDGDFALDASKTLKSPSSLAMGPDGSLYVLDEGWRQLYRITPDDSVHVVMGSYALGLGTFQDGAVAKTQAFRAPSLLAVGPEGDVYVADSGWKRVIRIGADGLVHSFAGDSCCVTGTEGKADSLSIEWSISGLAADASGNVFIAEDTDAPPGAKIWQVTPDGRMRAFYGQGKVPDHGIGRISAGSDGALYMTTRAGLRSGVVRRASDGTLSTVAGLYPDAIQGTITPANFAAEEGGFAAAARLQGLTEAVLGPDRKIYVSQAGPGQDENGSGIRRIGSEDPFVKSGELYYPSEDGSEVYIFALNGRHLRTVDVTTGFVRFSFTYDADGRLTKVEDADGLETIIQRTGGGLPLALVAPGGQRTLLSVDANLNLEAVTDSLANEEYALSPTSDGLLEELTDPRGNHDTYTYDTGDGRLESNQDAALATQTLEQTRTGLVQTVTRTTELNRISTYIVTRMMDGVRRRIVNLPGGAWTYRADSMNITKVPFGSVVSERGRTGETTLTYHVRDKRFGVLAAVHDSVFTNLPSGTRRTITTTRDTLTSGAVTETFGVNGNIHVSTYTPSTRVRVVSTPEGRVSSTILHATTGRPTSASIGSSIAPVALHYDANGRLDLLAQGGRGWRFGYDALGRLRVARDTLGRMVTYDYNNADRLASQAFPGGRTVSFGMNANGGLDTLVTPGGSLHRFDYTVLDQDSVYTPPSVGGPADNPTQYEYNADGQLAKITRPDGGLLVARYSASSGRLDSLMQARGKTAFTYLSSGQVSSVSSPDGITLNYGYDGPLTLSESWGNLRGSGSVDILATQVGVSFQDSVETLNGGVPVGYGFDNDGLLTSVTVNGTTESITHRAGDGLVSGTTCEGVTSAISYNSHGEPWKLRYDWPGGGSFEQVLDRDSLGRIVLVTESGISAHAHGYHYDEAGRLDSVAVDGLKSAGYTYDPNGNRVVWRGPSSVDTATATYDAQDRLLRYGNRAYAYTAAGELVRRASGPADSLLTTYDALGNLIGARATNGDILTYLIDGANRRVARTVNGLAQVSWIYTDGIFVAAELDSTGAIRNRYIYGTSGHVPDLVVQGGTTYRLVTDHLGSVRAAVNVSTGALAQRIDYDAWGVITTDTAPAFQSLGYAGGLQDRATGLVRFGARDYEPGTGRWTSKDPLLFDAGDENLYAYVGSAPIDNIDITGLSRLPGETLGDCLNRRAFETYGWLLSMSDAVGWYGVGSEVVTRIGKDQAKGLGQDFLERLLQAAEWEKLHGVSAPGLTLGERQRLLGSANKAAAGYARSKAALSAVNKALGTNTALLATGSSWAMRLGFWVDCQCE